MNAVTTTPPPSARLAGIVLNDAGQYQHHLFLLPARPPEGLNWQNAKAWAASVGGDLPSPQEQALLFANCRDALPKAWCWSNKEHEEDASCAWHCDFGNGYQSYDRKIYEGSAVAVSRSVLESFSPLGAPSARACTTPTEAPAPVADAIQPLRKRLHRWELAHLRKLSAEQAARLEAAQERIDALESELSHAWDTAESWRMDAMDLVNDLEEAGNTVGLTQSGHLVVVQQEGGAA